MFIVKPIIERARRPDKKDPGIDNPTKSPDLTPKAPSIIIKTSIIVACIFKEIIKIAKMHGKAIKIVLLLILLEITSSIMTAN